MTFLTAIDAANDRCNALLFYLSVGQWQRKTFTRMGTFRSPMTFGIAIEAHRDDILHEKPSIIEAFEIFLSSHGYLTFRGAIINNVR